MYLLLEGVAVSGARLSQICEFRVTFFNHIGMQLSCIAYLLQNKLFLNQFDIKIILPYAVSYSSKNFVVDFD